jgi:aspartyl-tRNA(Asn)/glutamyl-tRNA(Gln) amidotransferase subunit C
MAKITKKEVEHIAMLARLELSEEEKGLFTNQLNAVLTYMEKLNELDTKDVEPTSHILTVQNVFKEDEVKGSLPRENALANAPDKTEEFYRVPKIIE